MQATLSHYRIVEQIGAGGMGVVYRAHDERLDRDVALKVLPEGALADESARKRFRKEALALSKLNNPYIATVFDFDSQHETDFLVEELIEGLSLEEMLTTGPLPESEIINLGSQFAAGLAAAHEHGIIHCDLKPANLRVTSDSHLKILDFGLAKIIRAPGLSAAATMFSATETQIACGTLPYMAPEQLLNGKIDPRTDIWAAGCVLYEMATGRRPFMGSGGVLTEAILHHPPVAPSNIGRKVAPALQAIILKCLEKDSALRYASARDLAVDLRRLGTTTTTKPRAIWRRSVGWKLAMTAVVLLALSSIAAWFIYQSRPPAPSAIRSIAVLPLANLSADPDQEYFADGMTDALITHLSKIAALKVISRTSVMRYKGSSKSLPEIARELQVNGIVEGSVLRSGDRVRITAQLIYAPGDRHLWAESYDRDLRDVLGLQSDVAAAIAREIQVKLSTHERTELRVVRPINPQVHEAYLRGRYFVVRFDRDSLLRARTFFQQAIAGDPTYAPSHAGLAHAYFKLSQFGSLDIKESRQALANAKATANKALEIDAGCAEAHAVLGTATWFYDFDWSAAQREHRLSLQLDPNSSDAHRRYAMLLAASGRWHDAIAEVNQAQNLDPLSVENATIYGQILTWSRDYDGAIVELQKALELDPGLFRTHNLLTMAYWNKGMYAEACREYAKSVELSGRPPDLAARYRQICLADHTTGLYRAWLASLLEHSKTSYVSAVLIGLAHGAVGDKEEAFASLEKAYRERDGNLLLIKAQIASDFIRSDPRFADLVRRVGIPQ